MYVRLFFLFFGFWILSSTDISGSMHDDRQTEDSKGR